MSKCLICGTRKGKRQCAAANGVVCSECCGETRIKDRCVDCIHFKERAPTRRYLGVPRFSTEEMDSDVDLQSYAYVVEAALCLWDHNEGRHLTDGDALEVLEMLLDKYCFCDPNVARSDDTANKGFKMVDEAIGRELYYLSREMITRILGVIYFVAKRRTIGGREYFGVIHRYVGVPVKHGAVLSSSAARRTDHAASSQLRSMIPSLVLSG